MARGKGWEVHGTCASQDEIHLALESGVSEVYQRVFSPKMDLPHSSLASEELWQSLNDSTYVLTTIPPIEVEATITDSLSESSRTTDVILPIVEACLGYNLTLDGIHGCQWKGVAYISSTAVYGDHGGEWVDENAQTLPKTDRGKQRLHAETAWSRLFIKTFRKRTSIPLSLYRLGGIYGPDR